MLLEKGSVYTIEVFQLKSEGLFLIGVPLLLFFFIYASRGSTNVISIYRVLIDFFS